LRSDARVVRGHEQQLVGAVESARERSWVGVVAVAYRHAAVGDPLGLRGIARDDGDVLGGDALEEMIDGGAGTRRAS
jgi:hypothetical protein